MGGELSVPRSGLVYQLPRHCTKVFNRAKCVDFYRELFASSRGEPMQCPQGFCAWGSCNSVAPFAVTGLIPFPRLGGPQEKQHARDYPKAHVNQEDVRRWILQAEKVLSAIESDVQEEMGKRLEALHEVRRLNQLSGTIAERICRRSSPNDPEHSDPDLVRMWKATGLISVHLDALDFLANPELISLGKREPVVFYQVVDKMVRLYRILAEKKGVVLGGISGNSIARALVEPRTLHIIPSVFLDNAIKYANKGESVSVFVSEEWDDGKPILGLTVESIGPTASRDEQNALFRNRIRGQLAAQVATGTGLGLLLASRVSEQHGGCLSANQAPIKMGRSRWSFSYKMPGILE